MKNKRILILSLILTTLGLIAVLAAQKITGKAVNNDNELTLEQLRSLPYMAYSEEKADRSKMNVIKYDEKKAYDGYNLYESTLIDMEGNVIKKWPNRGFIKILHNGDIIAINWKNYSIGKYTWDNDLIWERKDIMIHHEIALTPDNTILTITKEVHEYNGRKVEFDVIVELNQDGNELSRWSTWENFEYIKKFHRPTRLDKPKDIKTEPPQRYDDNPSPFGGDYDYYHLNSIQVLPKNPLGEKDKRFQPGNWLICLRYPDLIVILDKDTKEIVWDWGKYEIKGEGAHMPRMLDNGNMLIFDNGSNRKYSRVIEIDPSTEKIVWEYKANPPELFFSRAWGSAQRFPNGNTLIADSANGRAFEVTKDKKVVWEWFNPTIKEEGKRKNIYRMIRYPKDKISKILVAISSNAGKEKKI